MQNILLYNELAYLWPAISPPEDYTEEAVHWRKAIRAKLGEGRHRLLELGVGGGHNLSHLTAEFDAAAVDISPKMLELSQHLNPTVEHHLGDMRTFRLPGQVFDAVLIHDAISYMLTEDDLREPLSPRPAPTCGPAACCWWPPTWCATPSGPVCACNGQRSGTGWKSSPRRPSTTKTPPIRW